MRRVNAVATVEVEEPIAARVMSCNRCMTPGAILRPGPGSWTLCDLCWVAERCEVCEERVGRLRSGLGLPFSCCDQCADEQMGLGVF